MDEWIKEKKRSFKKDIMEFYNLIDHFIDIQTMDLKEEKINSSVNLRTAGFKFWLFNC